MAIINEERPPPGQHKEGSVRWETSDKHPPPGFHQHGAMRWEVQRRSPAWKVIPDAFVMWAIVFVPALATILAMLKVWGTI